MRTDLLPKDFDDQFVAAGVGRPIHPPQIVARLIVAVFHELHALAGRPGQLRAGSPLRRAARRGKAIARSGVLPLDQGTGEYLQT